MKKILFVAVCAYMLIFKMQAQSSSESASPSSPSEKPKIDVKNKFDNRVYQAKDKTANSVIDKPVQRVEGAIDRGIDSALDRIGSDLIGAFTKKKKTSKDSIPAAAQVSPPPTNTSTQTPASQPNTKKNTGDDLEEVTNIKEATANTFKRGARVIFEDNFMKDAIGDFPAQWNTGKGGEIIQLKNREGKWLKINNSDAIRPELKKALPENFTIEFDVIAPAKNGNLNIRFSDNIHYGKAFHFDYESTISSYSGAMQAYSYRNTIDGISNSGYSRTEEKGTTVANKTTHFAIEVNGKRIRWYVDSVKKIDLPTVFIPSMRTAFVIEPNRGGDGSFESTFYISNVVIAEASIDVRSNILKELMEKGSFSTNAILFASNSFSISSGSDGVLSQISLFLKENPSKNIKIIGHTDNVGNPAKNATLSLNRAGSVKTELANKYGIESSRIVTEGKGANEPIAANTTDSGKAQNRRVEFVVF